jgi:outer membrane receptor protein involved in Fe transport
MFMDDHSVSQAAPSGIFGQTFEIACNNPMLSAQEVGALCTSAGLGPADKASLAILRRNVEGGGRQDDLRHTDYRIVIGAKGDVTTDWTYDVYGLLSRSVYAEEFLHDMSLRNIADALNVVDAGGGNLVCASGNTGCVPYNIFTVNGVTPEALNYIQQPGLKEGSTSEAVLSASLTGKLNAVKSPWAMDSMRVALGAEYRRENLELRVDNEFASGDLSGQGGPTGGQSGAFQVSELYGEARIPLIEDMPFAKSLAFEAGYRFSDYQPAGITNTYKFAGDWQVVDDFKLRASYERAVRAPNVLELFLPQQVALLVNADPCVGAHPTDTQAQCANTGVPLSAYGTLSSNPAAQYNGLQGGNPNLKPEIADTYSFGGVFTPRFIPGLTMSVDYFNIKVNGFIQADDPNIILNNCALTGNPTQCAKVHRVPGNNYSLWLGTTGYVEGINTNAGYLKTDGVDVDANYRLRLSNLGWANGGSLQFHLVGTYLIDLITSPANPLPDSSGNPVTSYNCAGLYGLSTCGTPAPKWRHQFRVTWNTPWSGWELSAAWRYFDSVKFQGSSTNPFLAGPTFPADLKFGAQSYFDLSTQVKLQDRVTFRLGVNNVFDKIPPLGGSNVGGTNAFFNGNTYPGVYDSLGRYGFAGITADF